MSRMRARLASSGAAVVLAVTAAGGAAVADTTPVTPAAGQAVITTDVNFLSNAALNGIVVIPLQPASPSYDQTAGLTVTFPVSGGAANIPAFYGDVQFGGGLLFLDLTTGRSVTFKQLDFSVADGWFTAVPNGSGTPVPLLDPAGDNVVNRNGLTQNLTSSSFQLDAEGAKYLDAKLGTGYFTTGQQIGSLALSYTPAH
ncbi:hypothetical protein [Streptomyces sp. 1331.2]|uniref:hypothetical protein n=1 Tax=Streptomyces sp. 1331.2 TaxID=1938835 RepID=UPI000BC6B9C2|nr:hypothetical protein [Streptomyces sp. 1331.2]SOB82829.1 hypothetical protein SAMN06272789_3013 [Streptomyces sp. 1331.2]